MKTRNCETCADFRRGYCAETMARVDPRKQRLCWKSYKGPSPAFLCVLAVLAVLTYALIGALMALNFGAPLPQ